MLSLPLFLPSMPPWWATSPLTRRSCHLSCAEATRGTFRGGSGGFLVADPCLRTPVQFPIRGVLERANGVTVRASDLRVSTHQRHHIADIRSLIVWHDEVRIRVLTPELVRIVNGFHEFQREHLIDHVSEETLKNLQASFGRGGRLGYRAGYGTRLVHRHGWGCRRAGHR